MKLLLTCVATFFCSLSLQAQSFDWVKGGGSTHTMSSGSPNEEVASMATDHNGNIYILSAIGNLGPIIADTFYRPSAFGSSENVMFASYTCDGQMRFAKLFSGNSLQACSVVCDTSGHVYVAMSAFHGNTTVTTLRLGYDTAITDFRNCQMTLVQYDTMGHLNWIRFVGENVPTTLAGTGGGKSSFAMIDGADNIHFIVGTKYGVPLSPTLTSHWGNYDHTYDASGALLSIKKLQIDSSLILMGGGVIDKSTNKLYVYGTRHQVIAPDSSYHPYVAAFDTDRNLLWIDTLANPVYPESVAFGAITTDNTGNLYLTGGGAGSSVYRNDTIINVLTSIPQSVSFVLKTDTSGNVRWMKGFSCSISVNYLTGITLTPNGNVVAAGGMAGKIVSGTDTITLYTGEGQNSWFTVIDTSGFIDSMYQLHGTGFYDNARCVVSDRTGNIYIGGKLEADVWAGSLTPYTSIGGNSDYYIMKYGVDCGCTAMPEAAFTHSGLAVHSFTYTGTTTPAIDSVRWYFGDGGTSTALSPTHTYTTSDTFTASVRVYTACGSDLYSTEIIIPCVSAPIPAFAMSGTGLTRTFTYTGTTAGLSAPVSWTFTGGTGPTSGTPVSRTFPAAGTYTACVTATNACGTTATCNPVVVACSSTPVSSFTSAGSGLTRAFTFTGTTAGLDSVRWTFSDGGTATGLSTSYTFPVAGTYTVCARVYTNCGTDISCTSIVVSCVSPPSASYTFAGTGATRAFTYTGTTIGLDSVRWDFGDGGTSAVLNPSHTFTTEDTFHVCLHIYTNCGTDVSCQDIIVTCFLPIVSDFSDTGNLIHGFLYTGTTAGYDSVVWTFDDGSTDTGLSVIHTYATADTFHVCAKVYTDCGAHTYCKDIIVNTVAVPELSLAGISVYPNPTTQELTVTGIHQQMNFRIISVVGVILQQGSLQPGANTIPTSPLATGIYTLDISGNNGQRKILKFLKQ